MLRRKRFWLGLIISLVFLGFFLVRTDFGEIWDAFAGANYLMALAAVPLYFVSFWIRTMRWHFLIRPVIDIVMVHPERGRGMVGFGLTSPPLLCFEQAVRALDGVDG